ncbi:MAG: glycosyltransferase family 2 protein [Pseudomonadota bacterium]
MHKRAWVPEKRVGDGANGSAGSPPLSLDARDDDQAVVPPELLVLNRFGIGYPYIKVAWKMSLAYGMDGREVLFRAGVISRELWAQSEILLAREREARLRGSTFRDNLLDHAVNALHRKKPHYSAHITFTASQLLFLAGIAGLFLAFASIRLEQALLVALMIVCTFYTGVVVLRAYLLAWYDERVRGPRELLPVISENLPVYSLLVPLYREANQVEALTQHLAALNWPLEKLDIKLICERDDPQTITAIHDAKLPACFELVIVPRAEPRTKPKALNYALPLCRGEFAVIYDAEDRPDPNQLREAWSRFAQGDPDLACLQAPLIISNSRQSWLSAMFHLEYLTLFRGILPVLAKWRVPIPLGGTSNHFRKSALQDVGGWDPYNVTEDADLGIRLFREGFHCSTLDLPTFEEAPPSFMPWLKQRTRWVKGWMQTILVHTRNPAQLTRDLGFKNTAVFHLLLTSIVISSLVHPVFLASVAIELWRLDTHTSLYGWFTGYGMFNLVAGYTTYGLLAHVVMRNEGKKRYLFLLISLPLYWMLISIAACRALVHLIVKPHRWEKTPHGLADSEQKT